VADQVVAGQSAEDLLGAGATGGATYAIQRKEGADDGQILDHQAKLKNTDVEIPALEGAPQDPPGSGPARPALEGVVRRGSPAIPGDDPAPTHGGGR
jgi:hypothetical protein